jgi:glycosyltransferase involved in cell wall biosynthesis
MAPSSPTVSVVIPTYRHDAFVVQTLDSVFAQTFSDIEVIVVNDGSPDDTAALLRPIAQQGRIRYLEQANVGQAFARNRGMAEARGEFIGLLDDDDLWPPDKLAWQVEVLRAHPKAAVVYGRPLTIDEAGGEFVGLDGDGTPFWWLGPDLPGGDVYAP